MTTKTTSSSTKATFNSSPATSSEAVDQSGASWGPGEENGEAEVTNLKIFNPGVMNRDGVRGIIFTGEYVKYEEVERKRNSDGRPFISKSHQFTDTTDGSTIILNSSGLFDYLIKKHKVTTGTICEVSYRGIDAKGFHAFGLTVDPQEED